MSEHISYNLPFGAQLLTPHRTRFRVWAPVAKTAQVEIEGRERIAMVPDGDNDGWFEAEVDCGAGTRYQYVMMSQTEGEVTVPDPASRAQVEDVHGYSIVVDANSYDWKFANWRGRPWEETVLYELHVGLLGGFAGVQKRLPELAALGITAVELMPVAEFPGDRNWGYDGVLPFAPDAAYGTPDQLKALIDTAHGLGMMVFLDVVFNHFGPDGNYLPAYASPFFRQDVATDWGETIDFRLPEVSDYFMQAALYWIQEYRFDGLRLDAAQAIREQDWLPRLSRVIRQSVHAERHVHLVLEHGGNAAHLLDRARLHDASYTAQWNDDGHHVLHVLLTGEKTGYYEDYADQPADRLARCLQEGFVYQGDPSMFNDGALRGEPSAQLMPTSFVLFLQNHDQTGNRAMGERLTVLAHPAALRAAMGLLLLGAQIPMLFMGEEFGARQPFLYFTSHKDEVLAQAVRDGRRREFARFPEFSDPEKVARIPDPNAVSTFEASRPVEQPADAADNAAWRDLVTRLLHLRATRIVPHLRHVKALEARALGAAAVNARWRLDNGVVLNLTVNLAEQPVPQTLDALATVAGADSLYDSGGVLDALIKGSLPGHCVLALLEPAEAA